jgi:peptide/nickel transport system permease protein
MGGYIIRRILATVPVMLVVTIVVFLLLHLAPGDPAAVIAGENARTEDIEFIRVSLGLDRPLPVQFGEFIGKLCRGDLGNSIFNRRPVLSLIGQRLEPTAALTALTMTLAVLVALPLGILAAWNAGTWIDRSVMALGVVAFSMPVFMIGYTLVFGFALEWRLLPVQGFRSLANGAGPFFRHLILPSVTLGLVYIALLSRMTRSTMLEVLHEDYIRTARSKGLGTLPVLLRHALRNAALPIVTTIGIGIGLLLGGVVVTESVFGLPGLGRLIIEAATQRDYPVIQGVVLVTSFAYVVLNLLIDLSYAILDPRIRY